MMPQSLSPRSADAPAGGPVLLASIRLVHEQDVVLARQKARHVAQLLGFDAQDQVRIAAAASEIAREGRQLGDSTVRLCVESEGGLFLIQLECTGDSRREHGAPDFRSREGIISARRMMGHFTMVHAENSTVWEFGRPLARGRNSDAAALAQLAQVVSRAAPRDLYQEFQAQNTELVEALADLRRNQAELAQVNRELEETNRGVLALYAELEEQARSLSRTNEQKTRFYSSVSHEFRTPVTSILSLSQILLERLDGDLTPEQERQISLIRRCGQNLLEWVNDLLDLARADAGRMDLRLSEFNLHDLMTGVRGIMRPLATSDQVALVFEDAPELAGISLYSDEGKVAQILRNLISNALKFTEQGEVRVAADPAATPGDSICFRVSDTGIGIATGDIERIFDEFVQVDSARQRQSRGTGLGLPLSRRLAGLLGGSISVMSVVGEGSTFQLVIPRRLTPREGSDDDRSAVAANDDPENGESPGGPLILVVDDDEASRYLLSQILKTFTVTVREAADGFEALKLAEDLAPRLVFLDLGLPGLSGFEVLEALKQAPATREIPVVIYTSQVVDLESDSRLKGQALAVLHKPAGDEGPPVEQIRDALERSRVVPRAQN